jgi:dienelactone hydrolase
MAGQVMVSQGHHNDLQEAAEKYHGLIFPKMSKSGEWFTIWQSYHNIADDTVFVFNNNYPDKPAFYRTKLKSIYFLRNNNLLIQSSQQAELFDPEKQTSIYFKEVKQVQPTVNKEQFLIHYGENENNRLELRDCSGRLLSNTNKADRFFITDGGNIYVITKNENGIYEVYLVKDDLSEVIYSSTHKIISLTEGPDEKGIMIFEQKTDNDSREIVYLDLTTRIIFPLKEVLPETIENGLVEEIRKDSIWFLRLFINEKKADTSLVDIWYGNDNRLEEKFYPPTRKAYYFWQPYDKLIRKTETDTLSIIGYIGNERYFLSIDTYLLQDYTSTDPVIINVYDCLKGCCAQLDTVPGKLNISPGGQYVLYLKNKSWYIYSTASGVKRVVGNDSLQTSYFANHGKAVLFDGVGGLWLYDINKKNLIQLSHTDGYHVSIMNGKSRMAVQGMDFYEKTINSNEPLILKLSDSRDNSNAYLLWRNGNSDTIIPPTSNYISYLTHDEDYKNFCYVEENYNIPPRLIHKAIGGKGKVIFQSNKTDLAILSLKQEIISYNDNDGTPLKGILYYPLHYSSSQKHPMIVHIYEKQNNLANRYPYPSFNDDVGFNIRLLIEKGYFVYLPDILIRGKEGPGIDALECVSNALDAIAGNPLIDMNKVGLIGHSFGGYETDFIATHSTRFAAYVSGSGISDILWMYHSFNYDFLYPDYKRVEANQFKMGEPFSDNKAMYFKNNPIYYVDNVNAPVLLWSGLEDKNVTSDQSMAFYNALRRNEKIVTALYYKGEGHGLRNPLAQIDLTSRILDWFDYFLKGDTGVEWISREMK